MVSPGLSVEFSEEVSELSDEVLWSPPNFGFELSYPLPLEGVVSSAVLSVDDPESVACVVVVSPPLGTFPPPTMRLIHLWTMFCTAWHSWSAICDMKEFNLMLTACLSVFILRFQMVDSKENFSFHQKI